MIICELCNRTFYSNNNNTEICSTCFNRKPEKKAKAPAHKFSKKSLSELVSIVNRRLDSRKYGIAKYENTLDLEAAKKNLEKGIALLSSKPKKIDLLNFIDESSNIDRDLNNKINSL